MYSDAVSKIKETSIFEPIDNGNGFQRQQQLQQQEEELIETEVFEKWKDWQPSQISHHGRACCEIAREWITSTDFSELGGGSIYAGPRWLRQRFNWGASSFPIFWCEAVRRKTLDCGALAALAHEVFAARGVKSFRVQLVQRFSHIATSQWSRSWNENGDAPLGWIDRDLIYHEGCATLPAGDSSSSNNNGNGSNGGGREIKVWDASAGWWVDPKSGDGYGSLLALRLTATGASAHKIFSWGPHSITPGRWHKLS